MDFQHEPVLPDEVLKLINPISGGVYCDATIGGGGHAERLLEASSPHGRLIGIDRDPFAVEAAKKRLARFGDRVSILHGKFSDLPELLAKVGVSKVDGLLVDLGVSSHQLDTAERGFSFMRVGPLDMRMNPNDGESAAMLLHRLDEDELADIIYNFGGERMSRPIAKSIKQAEKHGTLNNTGDLAVAVRRVIGRRSKSEIDPSTRTFQAVRIAVNKELEEVEKLLQLLPEPLASGGTVVIISFHSLEDRLVKQRFKALAEPCICPPGIPICECPKPSVTYVTRRAIKANSYEQGQNPRARSARIRSVRRI